MSQLHNNIKKTVMVQALVCAFGAVVLSAGVATTAYAQSNATATIYGQVAGTAGGTIVLENAATGTHRTITPDASGKFQATSMPPGRYTVKLMQGAAVVGTQEIEALVGQGTEASFGSNTGVQAVTVSGRRQSIDVSNTNNGSVFTAKQLTQLPIPQTVAGIIQLATGTTRSDPRMGGDSFAGSGASENGYYINGFPVTNIYKQIGGTTLPFFAIAQAQILSGGYSAEFGRSTGGVVNITTKSGTNTWEVGGTIQVNPNVLRAKPRNQFYTDTGVINKANGLPYAGQLYKTNEQNDAKDTFASVFVSGPLIKDKLFAFVNVEQDQFDTGYVNVASDSYTLAKARGFTEKSSVTPRYLAKIDFNITDNHHLEFTQIHDEFRTDYSNYGFLYGTAAGKTDVLARNNVFANGSSDSAKTDDSILKYTGYVTDDLTVTALYGQFKTTYPQGQTGYTPGIYQVNASPNTQVPGISYPIPQLVSGSLQVPNAEDSQKTFRFDVEYKIGKHALRAGIDRNTVASINGKSTAGGGLWTYHYTDAPGVNVDGGSSPASGGGLGPRGYYVDEYHEIDAATPTTDQSAQYIQDRFQVLPNLILDLGLRNEQFTNKNSFGVAYAAQRHQLAPRVGFAWDVNNDGSTKVFANAGRYHLQIPTSVAQRVAGSPLHTNRYYTYTGVDQTTGAPTGLTPISPLLSASNEFGQAKDPTSVAAVGLGAMYQDEMTMGFERAWSPALNFGAKFTYRTLRSTIEDWCDGRPVQAWMKRNNVPGTYNMDCTLINPGSDATLLLDLQQNGKFVTVPLTAADIGLPKVKRVYTALDLFMEHPLRDGWYGKVSYTLSRSKGNLEGQVESDINQADIAATTAFDFPELMQNADGLLPNNHTHAIKAFGFYQIDNQFSVGANLNIVTGSPLSCMGRVPTALNLDGSNPAAQYGSLSFYCNDVPAVRGSAGTLPTDVRLALNGTYKPQQVLGLAFKVDVFNVFNRQVEMNENQGYNNGKLRDQYYGLTKNYSPERNVKLTVEYAHKF